MFISTFSEDFSIIMYIYYQPRGLQDGLRHDRGVVVGDLPLAILINVHKTVASLHHITSCAHGELINSSILGPAISDPYVAISDHALGFLQQKGVKIVLDEVMVGPGSVRDSREEHCIGCVPGSNSLGVSRRKGVIPK